MPRRRNAASLKHACLVSIARNMDTLWCADYKNKLHEQGNFLHFVGPFEYLSSNMIRTLMTVLVDLKLMKRYYLHLLVDSCLEQLDLNSCKFVANKDSIINLVTVRCRRLTKLNIAMCNQVSARMLADLVGALPNIQSLNLQQTKCNDQVLGRIGSSCQQLRELNILGCPVTDMGIMSLVVTFEPSQPKCEKLLKLDISSTAVTCKGASIALTNLKQIKFLVYPDICEVLYRLYHSHQAGDDVAKEKQHDLRLLTVSFLKSNLGPVEKTVEVSCAFCPNITEVNFIHGVTNESLLYLSSLEHLRILNLANSNEELITFEDGLVPLLQMRGENLHELSLYEINNVDIGVIGACCHSLKKLTCLIAGFKTAKFPMHTHPEILMSSHCKPFTKLTHLKVLLHTPEKFFPPEYLRALLCNASRITEVQLAFIETLTDELFEEVLSTNSLECLETLSLEDCNKFTVAPMILLLEGQNDLTHLALKRCKEITLSNFEYLADLAGKSKYDLEILWT